MIVPVSILTSAPLCEAAGCNLSVVGRHRREFGSSYEVPAASENSTKTQSARISCPQQEEVLAILRPNVTSCHLVPVISLHTVRVSFICQRFYRMQKVLKLLVLSRKMAGSLLIFGRLRDHPPDVHSIWEHVHHTILKTHIINPKKPQNIYRKNGLFGYFKILNRPCECFFFLLRTNLEFLWGLNPSH